MYPVSAEFMSAIEKETVHHIRGTLSTITGNTTIITDTLCGDISTYTQCVNDSMQFNYGGMYVGTMDCTLNLPYSMKDELKGGTVVLDFGAETSSGIEYIPMGVWNVQTCTRATGGRVKLSCTDNIGKLLVDTETEKKSFVGVVTIETLMKHVTALTGVHFAQTLEELEAICSWNLETEVFATHYGPTAWAEVKSIAQILGCFAFANREGKIEFKRLDNTTPVLDIPADRRHKSQLEEYTYSVKGLSYTDAWGITVTRNISGASSSGAVLGLTDCMLVWDSADNPDTQYAYYLDNIMQSVKNIRFTPGEIEYYGNPAIDVGDYVTISGGTAQYSGSVPFLICCNAWKFRGPQKLTCCGFSESGTDKMSSVSKELEQIRTVNITKTIKYILANTSTGTIFSSERQIARIDFSSRSQTPVFFECSLVLTADATGDVYLFVNTDGSLQSFMPVVTVREGEYTTHHFSFPVNVTGGSHSITLTASGDAIAEAISCYIWGQNIAEISAQPTESTEYIYLIDDEGNAEIIYYIGDKTFPEIPSQLEGSPVTSIAATAFDYSDITAVYIPDGVTEIG